MARKKQIGYTIKSLLICDDVRREESGKEILIGVYNSVIILPSLPAAMSQIFVHIVIEGDTEKANEFVFRLVDDKGTARAELKSLLPKGRVDLDTVLNLRINALMFTEETRIDILFGIGREPEKIGVVHVRLPDSEEERTRVQKIRNA